jgi:organic hydroperoxide reductase OsmC/OhrA
MSEHKVALEWKRETESFAYESYNRDHVVAFEGGVRVPASAAPDFRGNPAQVNPEEALVAALSSCHMLTILAIAAKKRFVVDRYSDEDRDWGRSRITFSVTSCPARLSSPVPFAAGLALLDGLAAVVLLLPARPARAPPWRARAG